MPFCAACDRFYNPNTLDDAGECPEGHHVADPGDQPAVPTVPWHFKLMVVALIAYLSWRFVDVLTWFIG